MRNSIDTYRLSKNGETVERKLTEHEARLFVRDGYEVWIWFVCAWIHVKGGPGI